MLDFPDIKGFSLRNIKYIRQWYIFWSEDLQNETGQQLVAQIIKIPWGHNWFI